MWESKEKMFFKLIHGSAKEETSKEAKIIAKEKGNRLNLLLQKLSFMKRHTPVDLNQRNQKKGKPCEV